MEELNEHVLARLTFYRNALAKAVYDEDRDAAALYSNTFEELKEVYRIISIINVSNAKAAKENHK